MSTRAAHGVEPESDSEHGGKTDKDEDELDQEGADESDLIHFDETSLKERLSSEHPQWNNNPVKTTSCMLDIDRSDPHNLLDNEDIEDNHGSTFFPDHEPGTTTSEFDGALDQDEEDEEGDMDEDKLDSEPESRRHKKVEPCKCEAAHFAEVPKWSSKHHGEAQCKAYIHPLSDEEGSDDDDHHVFQINKGWLVEAHYMPVGQ
ncbi:hypothetical protein BDZ97DRAFT_1926527 [Flammula alnicola]|nr:hypothetical protein BDZ97DRAFT_1926527 [Flammula alnicola]